MVSSFQNCHLERRERTRLRVCSRSRKTCYLPMRRTCRRVIAAECRQKSRSLDSARSSASGRSCCARDDRVEVGTMEFVCRGVRHLPPFAKSAKDGAPLVYGGVGKVHGSFIGSPWLCQGLRCLRMTAFRGRMRPFDNSPEMMPSVCWFPLFKVVILSGTDSLASLFPESKDLLFARATDLPPGDCCRALAEKQVPRLRKIVRERTILLRSG